MPSTRIGDDRKTPMEGTSRLRHIRRLSHGDDTPKAVFREFWRFDARRTSKEATQPKGKKGGKGSGGLNNNHLSKNFLLQQKRMNAVSRKVTTTPNQGHPNVDSQAFNNWLRLHFGGQVPEARPLHNREGRRKN